MLTLFHGGSAINLTKKFPRVLMTMVFAAVSTMALAQAGQLDSTFANKGIFSDNFSGATAAGSAVALQSDGKIVVGGQTGPINSTSGRGVVLRLNSDGSIDTAFGSHGSVLIKFGVFNIFLSDLAIQTDGKILASGGDGLGRGSLVRLNPDGSFDTSFGSEGFAALTSAPGFFVLQGDGKIVVLDQSVGNGNLPGINQMERFNSNGTLDTTFGKGGTAALVSGGSAIALQSNGKFLVTSSAAFSASNLSRYNSDGSLDISFGVSGQTASLAGPGVAIQSDGHILTAGSIVSRTSLTANISGFGLTRFAANGTVDATFGSRGAVVTPFPGFTTGTAFPLLVQSNGDIVAGGNAGSGGTNPTSSFALARYLSTGQLDTTFGTGGLVTTSFGKSAAGISALALQGDGKIVAAGTDGAGNLVVARYLGQ